VERARSWRGRRRKELSFIVDGELPFDDMPQALDLPMFEWGINWYIAERGNHRLMLHAGVVERDGFALVLPALPGSGKSTLTAALATCGWRLLSDEFGPLDPADGRMIPMLRPVGLKNESIAIIRRFAPHAVLGPEFPGTHKGTVAHLAPDAHSVALRHQPARPIAVLFPKYDRGQAQRVERMPGGRAFIKLAGNSFNYSLLGPVAFASLRRLVEDVACYRIVYSTLEQAVDIAETLHRELLPRSTPPRTSTTSAAAGMLRVSG
jgi:HprK-related kinase A